MGPPKHTVELQALGSCGAAAVQQNDLATVERRFAALVVGASFADGFGFLALSTDATGTVDGQSVDLTVDGQFLGDNAEGSYGWMDGEIGVDPFSGYFVAKR